MLQLNWITCWFLFFTRTPAWLNKYGPPTRTDYRLTVENISSRVSWQVGYVEQATAFASLLLKHAHILIVRLD